MNFDDVRASLGMDYTSGAWFVVPESIAKVDRARPDKGRRVMLLEPRSDHAVPLCVPRSASTRSGRRHAAHPQAGDHGVCRLDRSGRILRWPLSIPAGDLDSRSWSCQEPDPAEVDAIIEWVLRRPRPADGGPT